MTEPTYEGLTRKFAEGMPSLGIFSDEGGQFLGGFAMSTDNRQKTLAALNDLWQGNPIRRTRQGEGSFTLHGRRLAVHLMVQPGVARDFMADPKADDTGFLPRFLICEPASTIGTRLHALTRQDDGAVQSFAWHLKGILSRDLPMDLQRPVGGTDVSVQAWRDIEAVFAMWDSCPGGGDGFLFGDWSIADAFYTPVATRFRTYAIDLSAEAQAYVDLPLSAADQLAWEKSGLAETLHAPLH